jgi:pimeloyl-ACP methyl ester carboxylesterase
MPFAYNGDVRIRYLVEGTGPPLVLHHGFSDSVETWYDYGYVTGLAERHRLLLVDARGHGASDKPHDPARYSPVDMVGDVIAVLDDCGAQRTDFYGHSMGGGLGLCMTRLRPDRLRSLITSGASPLYDTSNGDDQQAPLLFPDMTADQLVAAWESQSTISPQLRSRILANDMVALSALLKNPDSVPVENVLTEVSLPFLLLAGDLDEIHPALAEYSAHLPTGSFVTLPGLTHLQSFQRSDLLLPMVVSFLDGLTHTGALDS